MSSAGSDSEYESDRQPANVQTQGQQQRRRPNVPPPPVPQGTAQPTVTPATSASGGASDPSASAASAASNVTTPGGSGGVRDRVQQALSNAGQPPPVSGAQTLGTGSTSTSSNTQNPDSSTNQATQPVPVAQGSPVPPSGGGSGQTPVVGQTHVHFAAPTQTPLGSGTAPQTAPSGASMPPQSNPNAQGAQPMTQEEYIAYLQQQVTTLQLQVSSQSGTNSTQGPTGVVSQPTASAPLPAGSSPQLPAAASGSSQGPNAGSPSPGANSQDLQSGSQPTNNQLVPVGGQGSSTTASSETQIQPYNGGYGTDLQTYHASGQRPGLTDPGSLHGYGGATHRSHPTPSARTPMTAIASYGGYSLADFVGTPGYGFGDPFLAPKSWADTAQQQRGRQGSVDGVTQSAGTGSATPGGRTPTAQDDQQERFEYGMSPYVRNAVRMIQPFFSEGATVEKARSFWNAYERTTTGLNDAVRLNAFRVLLKGKTGEDWWMYSRIEDFETLRTRFYNQFICQTPLQMIERLRNAKRSKGMSAEVWGDVISNLCDAAQVTDPQMRYQYFLAGLRNKEWKAALQTTMVNDIPRAVMTLLYKNMHLPNEDDAEFEGESTKKSSSENDMMQKMMGLMQQTQDLLVTQNQLMTRPPRSPRNRVSDQQSSFIAAMFEDQSITVVTENAPGVAGGNRRMGPDRYTQEGLSVCGRCHFLGCSRETCRYNNLTCGNCKVRGHVAFECVEPRQQNGGGNRGLQLNNNGQQSSSGNIRRNGANSYGNQQRGGKCFLCDDPNHRVPSCPLRQTVMQLAANGATGATSVQGQAPAQH